MTTAALVCMGFERSYKKLSVFIAIVKSKITVTSVRQYKGRYYIYDCLPKSYHCNLIFVLRCSRAKYKYLRVSGRFPWSSPPPWRTRWRTLVWCHTWRRQYPLSLRKRRPVGCCTVCSPLLILQNRVCLWNTPNENLFYFTTQNFTLLRETLLYYAKFYYMEVFFFYKNWSN